MNTDIYTKSVLTVIAVCLFVSTFTPYDFISKAHAKEADKISEILSRPTEVKIVSIDSSVMVGVNLKRILGWRPAIKHYSYTTRGDKAMAPIIFSEPND